MITTPWSRPRRGAIRIRQAVAVLTLVGLFSLLLTPIAAYADDLYAENVLVADSTNAEFEPGTGFATFRYWLENNNTTDPANGCNINPTVKGQLNVSLTAINDATNGQDNSVAITIGASTTFGTASFQLTNCSTDGGANNSVAVTFSASSEGSYTVQVVAVDTVAVSGQVITTDNAVVTLDVVSANTAPSVSVTGVSDGASYEIGSVPAAGCDVVDTEDGNLSFLATLSAITGPLAGYGLGSQTASCSYTDGGGLTASASATYSIVDTTTPTITASATTADSNAYTGGIWTNQDVTVSFNCSDLSGVASVTPPTTLGEGEDQSVTGTCTDNGGNSAHATFSDIDIDQTKPIVAVSAANAAGPYVAGTWSTTNVTITFSCSDQGGSDLSAASLSNYDEPGISYHKTVNPEVAPADNGQSFTNRSCTDVAGNSADDITFGPVLVDKDDPQITAAGALADVGGPYTGGWTNHSVMVTFACDDDPINDGDGNLLNSGLAPNACPGATTIMDDTDADGEVVTGTVTDIAGRSSSASLTVMVDKTAPEVSGTAAPAPNANGWNNDDVTVTFSCTDGGSGVDAFSDPVILTGEGGDQSVDGTCKDVAGNSDTTTVGGINIDKTAPSIEGTRTPAANATGWNNTDVAVGFTCADGLSGVASFTSPVTLTGEGANQSVTGTCADEAGNSASVTVSGVSIDKTNPGIAFKDRTPAANADGWNNSDVTVRWDCTDALSGPVQGTVSQTLSAEGQNQSATGTCQDLAGNTASDTQTGVNIDKTAPTNVAFVGGISDGATYYFGFVPGAPTCTAEDDLSGFKSCGVSGHSTAVGPHTLTATAADKAGNTAETTLNYTVAAWTLKGFYQPVDMNGTLNTVKGGSTVPLKFEVFAGATELTDTAVVSALVKQVTCNGGTEDTIEVLAAGGTSLRYDTTSGQFIYNWQTPKLPGKCYSVTMTTQDGSSITAYFKLK